MTKFFKIPLFIIQTFYFFLLFFYFLPTFALEPISSYEILKKEAEEGEKAGMNKPIEEITILDIIQNENISPDLKNRIAVALNKSHAELDKYRTSLNLHYKEVDTKIVDFRNELTKLYDYTNSAENNLQLSKWMIISLSIGMMCLTIIVIIMWRSVVNVNRNDVELIFSGEKAKKEFSSLTKRIEMLEISCKKNGI